MAVYHYTVAQPEGGYDRSVKYRNPEYFDGVPEVDATSVLCDEGYPLVVESYAKVGIIVGSEPVLTVEAQAAAVNPSKSLAEMSEDELRVAYEASTGRKPGNMKTETMLAALEGE